MSGPPPAFKGDMTWDTALLVSSWIVGPLYGMKYAALFLSHSLLLTGMMGISQRLRLHLVCPCVAHEGIEGKVEFSTPEHLAQQYLYITNNLIGTAILVWRMWIIWGRNFWLTGPFIVFWFATAVTGYTALVNLSDLSATGTAFLPRVHNWLIVTWSLSIVTQCGATLMIGYRFWKSIKWNGVGRSSLPVLWILVESGALCGLTTIFLLGFSATNMNAIFASALGQISALAPTLIIVRAGLRSSLSSSTFVPVKGSIGGTNDPPSPSGNPDLEYGKRRGGRDSPLVVNMRKATELCLDDPEKDGNTSPSDAGCRSPNLPEYFVEYSDS
ncbi:hypothetical protein DFH94DRAFT_816468 [Russula ochroleuca]|uniref:Uncharacterized protein n=1 Tax=Russula ochroleuca TaxID=152965 RepID=A0A9P5JY15_9AGAM|nr:hypothetical protein DFH94DRAFT_816468 [Russula ochroleuca]